MMVAEASGQVGEELDSRCAGGVVYDKTLHHQGQDRQDQAERQQVEQDGDEQEGRCAAARSCS